MEAAGLALYVAALLVAGQEPNRSNGMLIKTNLDENHTDMFIFCLL